MADLSLILSPQTPADLAASKGSTNAPLGRAASPVRPIACARASSRITPCPLSRGRHFARRRQSHHADMLRRSSRRCYSGAHRRSGVSLRRHWRSAGPESLETARAADTPWCCWSATNLLWPHGLRSHAERQARVHRPVDPERLLYCELVEGALAGVSGRCGGLGEAPWLSRRVKQAPRSFSMSSVAFSS